MKDVENIEGMFDDDGLQQELGIVGDQLDDTSEEDGEGDYESTSPEKNKGEMYKQNAQQFANYGDNEDEEWILDHTGIRRKPFKVMHREIKEIIKDKIVIAHNLPKDFAYLRITRHD